MSALWHPGNSGVPFENHGFGIRMQYLKPNWVLSYAVPLNTNLDRALVSSSLYIVFPHGFVSRKAFGTCLNSIWFYRLQ